VLLAYGLERTLNGNMRDLWSVHRIVNKIQGLVFLGRIAMVL